MDSIDDIFGPTYSGMYEPDINNELPSLFDDVNMTKEDLMKHLCNYDYSLNSPLLLDELEEFLSYLKTGIISPRWNKQQWSKMDKAFRKKIEGCRMILPSEFSRWFGEFNLKNQPVENRFFSKILIEARDKSRRTLPILESFIKGWLGKIVNLEKINLLDIPMSSRKWGDYFWDLHAITLMLNATTPKECEYLSKTFKSCKHKDKTFDFKTVNFGKVRIAEGFVLFSKLGLFLDRNTILMMKDTYVARFNTLLVLDNRIDNVFPPHCSRAMVELYELGDRILFEGGSNGYQGIKLLEPLCNNRISEIAQTYRPLIPQFTEFKEHLSKSITSLSKEIPSIKQFQQLIDKEENVEVLLTMYGSYRHWGHPYINYFEGLEQLYQQVTMKKDIDPNYASLLASDLAFIVIKDQFKTKKLWPVDPKKLSSDHMLYKYIVKGTWPNNSVIEAFGPHWHELPLIKCFDIPDVIDPSLIYSDKCHSLSKTELINHLKLNPGKKIPSHRVLSTLLESPATNWPKFLQKINDEGISVDQLLIALRAKERELKEKGRYFALMSWEIRDYFVMTEYLIKTFFVPLFHGLTMADDLTTVMGKMLINSEGQGEDNYEKITIANHIDYEKWNNHQRAEANNPVFKVMGQFLGYPNLITRTHEIFEKSLIYYAGRGDLIGLDSNNQIINKTNKRVCWNGQAGGLEGLRQKGWSITSLLVLQREGNSVNTRVKVLAQGDNQVICTQYKLRPPRNNDQLISNINDVCHNNSVLFDRISRGTKKLGLIINQDETVRSAEIINYGKNIVFRGNIRNLETKKWSRVTCVTNDQLPTLANLMSTTSSNALAVSHLSNSPLNSMFLYNFYGHLVRIINEIHNPALRGPVKDILNLQNNELDDLKYLIRSLYLDPSIGGVCGTSLTRFLIRVFPDPITESLTFLKLVHDNIRDEQIKEVLCEMGNPVVRTGGLKDISKLIEDPLSLNVPRGIDATTMLKDAIKDALQKSVGKVKNTIVRKAIEHQVKNEQSFLIHLFDIKPLFPRFLSEYRSSTYFGIANAILGLFQNSKSIRSKFREYLGIKYDQIIISSEIYSIKTIIGKDSGFVRKSPMWSCSASHADQLRRQSWGEKVYGATVPHPAEMFGTPEESKVRCSNCNQSFPHSLYISVLIPHGFKDLNEKRGSCTPYMGSSTLESTSILQSWEKETKVPMLRRAASLRSAIGWFIEPDSVLAKSILDNLLSLTGEDWSTGTHGFKRTGSALHRFSCSRQSSGGYTAQNPSKLTRMLATTNNLADLGDTNYDFMYQACLLNALLSTGEIHDGNKGQGYYHQHLKCNDCLRPIEEIYINTSLPYKHPDVSNELKHWKPEETPWSVLQPSIEIQEGDWFNLSPAEKSFHIGMIQGFIFGDSFWGKSKASEDPALFPLTIRKKVTVESYLYGLLVGVLRSSILSIIHQRRLKTPKSYHQHILGHASLTLQELSQNTNLLNIWREETFIREFSRIPHGIPPSYPMISSDISMLGLNYMKFKLLQSGLEFLTEDHKLWEKTIWIFSDTSKIKEVGLLGLSEGCWEILRRGSLIKKDKVKLDQIRGLSTQIRAKEGDDINIIELTTFVQGIRYVSSEVRHAAKGLKTPTEDLYKTHLSWGTEGFGKVKSVAVKYDTVMSPIVVPRLKELRFQNPLISGLRIAQLATGSHYKLNEILEYLKVQPRGAICAGDGSGGIAALILRKYPTSRVIFNSLCDYKQVKLKGNNPSPPSAILHTLNDPERCINLFDCWTNPNDLSETKTWVYFYQLAKEHCLPIDIITMDMEVTDLKTITRIEHLTAVWAPQILQSNGILVFKTFLTRIFGQSPNPLESIGKHYARVELITTSVSSSQTSEVYMICQGAKRVKPNIQWYPDYSLLYDDTFSFPIFSDPVKEFKRALKLKKRDMLQGIPKTLISTPEADLMKLLSDLGVRSDLSYRYAHELGEPNQKEIPIVLFMLVCNSLISFTTGYKGRTFIPSDGVIFNMGVWVAGFFIWLGYTLENYRISNIGQQFIDNYFPFNYFESKIGGLYYNKWSLQVESKINKYVQLDSKMAQLGQVIRILQKNYQHAVKFPAIKSINKMCEFFNRGVTYKSFDNGTGLISLLRTEENLSTSGSIKKISLLIEGKEKTIDDQIIFRD